MKTKNKMSIKNKALLGVFIVSIIYLFIIMILPTNELWECSEYEIIEHKEIMTQCIDYEIPEDADFYSLWSNECVISYYYESNHTSYRVEGIKEDYIRYWNESVCVKEHLVRNLNQR